MNKLFYIFLNAVYVFTCCGMTKSISIHNETNMTLEIKEISMFQSVLTAPKKEIKSKSICNLILLPIASGYNEHFCITSKDLNFEYKSYFIIPWCDVATFNFFIQSDKNVPYDIFCNEEDRCIHLYVKKTE